MNNSGKIDFQVLDHLFAEALNTGVFPGAVIGVNVGPSQTNVNFSRAYGRLYAPQCAPGINPEMTCEVVFDLASLTKPLATVLALLVLRSRHKLSFEQTLPQLLKVPVPPDKAAITMGQLLGHCSGLSAHRPFFETLRGLDPPKRRQAMLDLILQTPLDSRPGETVVYSDLGYLLLGFIVEAQAGEPLDAFVKRAILAPLDLEDQLAFNPLAAPQFSPATVFAPTENCPWRGRTLVGQVHDDNGFVLGGVAGHAGLFGSIHGVLPLAAALLDIVLERADHPNINSDDLRRCTAPPRASSASTWGLGFDHPAAEHSSAGRLLSRSSFGHLGYTGTSFWCDPEHDLSIVLLTNRVHPLRTNEAIKTFRPKFHEAIFRVLKL